MPQPKTKYEQILDEANAALDAKDWPRLLVSAQLMRRERPDHPTAWSYLGIANFNIGFGAKNNAQLQEGMSQIKNATRLDPDSFVALSNYAQALLNLEQFAEALEVIDRAEAVGGLEEQHLIQKFFAQFSTKQFENAERTLQVISGLKDPPSVAVIPVRNVQFKGQSKDLSRDLVLSFVFDGEDYLIEEHDFDSTGRGSTLREAMRDYEEDFEDLVDEYVETDDPLDEGAQAMAERLRIHL